MNELIHLNNKKVQCKKSATAMQMCSGLMKMKAVLQKAPKKTPA